MAWKIGDRVMVHPDVAKATSRGVVFEVIELPKGSRGKNYRIKRLDNGLVSRCPGDLLVAAPADGEPTPAPGVTRIESEPRLGLGQVVTIGGLGWKQPANHLYVILGLRSDGQYKVCRLGGDRDRYYPKIPRSMLTPVDVPTTLS